MGFFKKLFGGDDSANNVMNVAQSEAEKYDELINVLNEWGVNTNEVSVYRDAVILLKKCLKTGYLNNNFKVEFGQFGIQSVDYDIINESQIQAVRKHLSSKKIKVNVRVFPTVKYTKNKYIAIVEPDLVLWELSGIAYETAVQIASEISSMLQIDFRVVSK